MGNLADRYGPRLTNSPQFRLAGDWAMRQLKEWGISNVHLEKWAVPVRTPLPSWQCTFFSVSMVEPAYQTLIGVPEAWSPATIGPITAEVVLMLEPLPTTVAELERQRGKVKGRIVLGTPLQELPLPTVPLAQRYTPQELAELAMEPIPTANPSAPPGNPKPPQLSPEMAKLLEKFFADEKPLAAIGTFSHSQGGTVVGSGQILSSVLHAVPTVYLAAEHSNRIARLLAQKVPVKLQLEIRTEVDETNKGESFNVTAEIPGNAKKDEVVMVGAHLDSWNYATGATDDGIGCAVAMEAIRILRNLNVKMDRTVRLALWGGEEQYRLGSIAYVKQHFADPAVMRVTPEHEKLSVYFNLDRGPGKIRGIYLQHNEMTRPIFKDWFAPLSDLTSGVVSVRDTRNSDHISFDEVGLPAFQFIQDPLDFGTRARHSNMDTSDRVQPADAEQMAVVVASFLYDAAMRSDRLPRKPPPSPSAARAN